MTDPRPSAQQGGELNYDIEEVPNYEVKPEREYRSLWLFLAVWILAGLVWFGVHAFDRWTTPPTIVWHIEPFTQSHPMAHTVGDSMYPTVTWTGATTATLPAVYACTISSTATTERQ